MASIGKSKVGFIGVGKLGQSCAEMVAERHDVVGYDVAPRTPENFNMVPTLREAVQGRDIVFLAPPTPHDPQYDGKAPTSHLPNKDFDYSLVKEILSQVNEVATKNQLVVLISTVLPGTVRRELVNLIPNARFIYNPYLIAMGTVKYDMVNPEMVMIGTEDGSETGDAKQLIDFYKTIMQNSPRYFVGTWDECECLKVTYNTFISAKVGLVNMIQDIAEKQGNINAEHVCDALSQSDRRIMGPGYMKPGMGDGGACVLGTFPVKVNGELTTMAKFYRDFDNNVEYTVESVTHDLSAVDVKKVRTVTRRSYQSDLILIKCASGRTLACTVDHLLPVMKISPNGVKQELIRAMQAQVGFSLYFVKDEQVHPDPITHIGVEDYSGHVYNMEVVPNDEVHDDQYYIDADQGVVVHNCHPRDNIALRWLAQELDLGYDLFDAVMRSREVQAENMAKKLVEYGMPVVIVGKAYKPLVPYDAGSSSMLVGHYVDALGTPVYYLDEVMGEYPPEQVMAEPAAYLLAHNPQITYGEQLETVPGWYSGHRVTGADEALTVATANGTTLSFVPGSVVVDPWRKTPAIPGVRVVHYGNTRADALR